MTDLQIPAFLVRPTRLTPAQVYAIIGTKGRDWAPIRTFVKVRPTADVSLFTNPDQPVVLIARHNDGSRSVIGRFASADDFVAAHDVVEMPVRQVVDNNGESFVITVTKPWSKHYKAPATASKPQAVWKLVKPATSTAGEPVAAQAAPVTPEPIKVHLGMRKVDIVAALLKREGGCTSRDVMDACGWPSVSMPAQAKAAGLTLTKDKQPGQATRYYGV